MEQKIEYVNIFDYLRPEYPFTAFIGGRGTGKTYSALRGEITDKRGFMLWRRTEDERKLATIPNMNPFNHLNTNEHWRIIADQIAPKLTGFFRGVPNDDGELKPDGPVLGYLMSLYALATVRGLSIPTDDVHDIIYDEFTPEGHVRELKNEGEAILNGYETINRNRELEGKPPVRLIMLSNSNKVDSPIFRTLGVTSELEKLIRKGSGSYFNKEMGLAIHLLKPAAAFEKAKKKTAIAKLTKGTAFYDMAYENEFSHDDFSGVQPTKLVGFHPYIKFGSCHVWQRKGSSDYYCTYSGGAFGYKYRFDNQADRMLANSRHGLTMRRSYAEGRILWESYDLKLQFLDFFCLK